MDARQPLLAAMIALASHGTGAAEGDRLAQYRWKARVLVLAAPSADDARLKAQRAALASARAGASERDLVILEALGSEGAGLRRRLGLPDDAFRAVLVGKDGGAKLTAEEPIPPQRLFATIDAMPMRRGEANRR